MVFGGSPDLEPFHYTSSERWSAVRYSGSRGITDQQSRGEGRNLAPNCQRYSIISPLLAATTIGRVLVRRAHLQGSCPYGVDRSRRGQLKLAGERLGGKRCRDIFKCQGNDGPMGTELMKCGAKKTLTTLVGRLREPALVRSEARPVQRPGKVFQ